REFTELQGTMGGIYAREEGLPEDVWKAIYFHYLPIGVESDAAPAKGPLGRAAVTWAAVSLADKLDTIVGLFAAGEKPTGSRDPYGLRRAAQGVVKILADMPARQSLVDLVDEAAKAFGDRPPVNPQWREAVFAFLGEREAHLFERRGYRSDEARAVAPHWSNPHLALKRIDAVQKSRASADFEALAVLVKRVNNITKGFQKTAGTDALKGRLTEPAEIALADEMGRRWPAIESALGDARYADAMKEVANFRAPVDRFFTDVMVMTEDPGLREARLTLLATMRDGVLQIADIAQIAPEETK
ncbi:MAG TPA: glycine--tRNA ligase subunit beta, partial [Vicinamibacterales bacterium]|nr:glycine--tRNA ligase subunit beta [Vicinamibacterales bacterium]